MSKSSEILSIQQRVANSFGHKALNNWSMFCLAAAAVVGALYFFDDRETLGVSLWEKPLKFLISTIIYSLTFSWFYGLTQKGKKIVWWLGSLIGLMLALEVVIIIGLAAAGLTSHFNVSSAFHIAMWSSMATFISTLWVLSFAVGSFLWRLSTIEPLVRNGIRWGLGIGLAGMGLAFTMTAPQAQQITPEGWQGIAGAHSVGVADGGPGLPFLGWSTVGGDLRISHFFGLHALQVFPVLTAILMVAISSLNLSRAFLHAEGVTYSLAVVILYLQALMGESIVAPSQSTVLLFAGALSIGVAVGLIIFLWPQSLKLKQKLKQNS